MMVRSDGALSCTAPMTCATRLPPSALTRLTDALSAVRTTASSRSLVETLCRDCYVMTLRLEQTTADGAHESVFSWAELAGGGLPEDIRAVYAAVRVIGQPTH